MTTTLLDHILKLFAITAYSGISDEYKRSFSEFIKSNVSIDLRETYIKRFEELLKKHQSVSSDKKVSLNSVKLIKHCTELKSQTTLRERYIIFVSLLNFIEISKGIDSQQKDYITLIAEVLEICKDDFNNILNHYDVTLNDFEISGRKLFYEDDEPSLLLFKTKADLILLKALKENIIINTNRCNPQDLYIIDFNSLVKTSYLRKYNYKDLLSVIDKDSNNDNYKLIVNDIEVKIKNQTILNQTKFVAESGEMIGIIGKSGSGKSTLLKAIAGINDISKGEIHCSDNNGNLKPLSVSFVSQENCFIPEFTVIDHLADRLKYLQIPKSEHNKIIDAVLDYVELQSHKHKIPLKSNNIESELSGGQQKRVSIAMSLLQNPEIVIMDEPASGLSATEALRVFKLLKTMALKNKIILCSVHQPDIEIFSIFDKILFINEEGYPVFYGKPAESADYFRKISNRVDNQSVYGENYNPAVIMDILEETTHNYHTNLRTEESNNLKDSEITKKKVLIKTQKSSFFESFKTFLIREVKILKKSPVITTLYFLIPLLLAVIISFISRYSSHEHYVYYYNPNIPAWIIMVLVSAFFTGLISTGHELIIQRKLRLAENIIHNTNNAYLSSKLVKVLGLTILQSLILTITSVLIIGLTDNILNFFMIIWALCFLGAISGLVLSSIFSSLSFVYLLVPVIIIPQILFAGALIDFNHFNKYLRSDKYVPIVADVIPLKYATEAVITDFYKNNKYNNQLFDISLQMYEADYYLNYFIPELLDIASKDNNRAENILNRENSKNRRVFVNKNDFNENIEELKEYYESVWINAVALRDSILENMDNASFLQMKYTNRALIHLVYITANFETFLTLDNEIVRKYMPIYKLPDNHTMRTHFLSPFKSFAGFYIETVYYNFIILMLFSLLLIIYLYKFGFRKT